MNELKKAWEELKSDTKEFTTIQKEELYKAIHIKSKGPIRKLHHQVKFKWYFCLFFTVAIGILIPWIDVLVSQILLLILLSAYLVGDILLYQEHKVLEKGIDMSQDLKTSLNEYYKRVKDVLKYEELVGLTLYPISLTAGFFIGMKLGAPEEEIMNETSDWIALVITMIIITPLAHLLAKWMNKAAFGKYLNELKKNIDELEKL